MPGPLPRSHIATLGEKLWDGHLGLFVGAGLSRLAPATDGSARRLPLWNELAKEVALACKVRVSAYRNILDLFDGITGKRDRPTLERAVREALDDKPFDPSPAHLALRELPWSAIFTINYHGLLARTFDKTPFFEERDYEKLEERRDEAPLLFYLHGTLDWPHTLTRDDYRSWRGKNRGAFLNLQKFVHDKTLLFVGYSLSDPHIGDLLAVVRDMTSGRPKEMFAWMWKLTKEDQELLAVRDKFHAFRIRKEEDWAEAFRQHPRDQAAPRRVQHHCPHRSTARFVRHRVRTRLPLRQGSNRAARHGQRPLQCSPHPIPLPPGEGGAKRG